MDQNIIEYCKVNDIDISELNINDINRIKDSAEYNYYKLNILFKELINDIGDIINPLLMKLINIIDKYILR